MRTLRTTPADQWQWEVDLIEEVYRLDQITIEDYELGQN